MARVQLEEVGKVYPGGVEAVRDVSIDVEDGQFVVLVGPSGCGKSTTLRLIAGLEEASSGRIRIGERVVNRVHPRDRDIAMVFQSYALYPHMTVRKNMSFALRLRHTPRREVDRRVGEAARMLGIEELLDRKPGQLSGGQRQRVALGRAIVRQPKAFLFDEPLSNLDAKLRVSTRSELKALHRRLGATSIYVTHDQEEAMTLGDRVVVMAEGVVQQDAAPMEVYAGPANRFVAEFVGSPPMNLVEGRIEREEGRLAFRATRGAWGVELPSPGRDDLAPGPATLGLRPQALVAAEPDGAGGGGIPVTIETVEPLGEHADVVGEDDAGTRLIARMEVSRAPRPGARVRLVPDPQRLHLFEPGPFGVRRAGGAPANRLS